MTDPQYAHGVFLRHVNLAGFGGRLDGRVVLELGPGDTTFSAISAAAYGAARVYLVDVAPDAVRDVDSYRQYAAYLRGLGLSPPDLEGAKSLEEILERSNTEYLVEGLDSLRTIEEDSVDLIWSQAVLEHVTRGDFEDTIRETSRILRTGGACSHRIDLKDHLASALNSLRFSEETWESPLFAESGFYTNRLRFRQLLDIFRSAGFDVEVEHVDRWEVLPTSRRSFSEPYRGMADEDLLVSGFNVVLRLPSNGLKDHRS